MIKTMTFKSKNTWFNKLLKPWLVQRKAGNYYCDELDDRKREERKKYPLRHIIFTDVPYVIDDTFDTFRRSYWRALKDYIRLRTWDKYHIIKIGEPDYYTHSGQMLYASFEILKNYVETYLKEQMGIFSYLDKEYLLNDKDYNTGPDMVKFIEKQNENAHKLIALYVWWTTLMPQEEAAEITKHTHYPKDYDSKNFFYSAKKQKSTGYYYLDQHIDKLCNAEKEEDYEEKYGKKLLELYSLWPSIGD